MTPAVAQMARTALADLAGEYDARDRLNPEQEAARANVRKLLALPDDELCQAYNWAADGTPWHVVYRMALVGTGWPGRAWPTMRVMTP